MSITALGTSRWEQNIYLLVSLKGRTSRRGPAGEKLEGGETHRRSLQSDVAMETVTSYLRLFCNQSTNSKLHPVCFQLRRRLLRTNFSDILGHLRSKQSSVFCSNVSGSKSCPPITDTVQVKPYKPYTSKNSTFTKTVIFDSMWRLWEL